MSDIVKIIIIFALMLLFIRLKWNVGYVMILASGLLFVLYLTPVSVVLSTFKSAAMDGVSIKLFLSLAFIRVFEMLLRERHVLSKMMEAVKDIFERKRVVIISMPMLIGLLPSLGGAYFSAPMVDESTKGLNMTQEQKGFINYWFRHPWEYILPLYPGILLASAISKIELRLFIFANAFYALTLIITGFLFGLRGVSGKFEKGPKASPTNAGRSEMRLLWNFFPVAFVIFMVIAMRMELQYSLGIVLVFLFIFYRVGMKDALRFLRHGFAREVLILIFGAMVFKFSMENSGAVEHLSRYFFERGIPMLPVFIALPFVSGLLTGLTVAFVGSTFPLLISMAGGTHLNQMSFAFAAGYAGVLLSPVHLCLVLTREYFNADIWGIYKRIIPSCLIIMGVAFLIYFWGG